MTERNPETAEEPDEFAISPLAICAWIAIALIIVGHVWQWVVP